jgi:type IV pilus assembly protein PilQ
MTATDASPGAVSTTVVAEDATAPVTEPMQVAQSSPRSRSTRREPVQPAPATPVVTDDIQLAPSGSTTRINLDVQNADIHTVLRTMADYSGRNIIASREVEGEVSARLYDTPWEDALQSILRAHGFGMVEEQGIIRVGVLQKLRNEELEEAAADRKRDDLLPIETQVVKLQFADADELKPALQDMMSSRGKLQVDARTNALIISDIPDFVTKVATMATDLDSRTPQVEIVTKLVDVSADNSRDLGIQWDAINIQPAGSPISGSASVDAGSATPVGSLRLGTVQSWGQLDAILDALEKDKKANVVSNPNITTVNNREAKILVGAKIPLIVADQAGNAITQLTKIGIQMSVVPHVNSDRTITMDLHTEVSELSSQATVQGGVIIQTSEADTRVLVDNGDTAIIGGLVRNVESTTRTGVPILQSMPLIGWLFRNSNTIDAKRELIIFVTPRLIEAGMKPIGPQGSGQTEK